MVTVEKLKSYLRIDTDYEDELLEGFLTSAKSYLKGAVTDYASNYLTYSEYQTKADLLTMIIAAEFYQNRDNTERNFSYAIKTLIAQLQYFVGNSNSDVAISPESGMTIAMFDSAGNLINSGIRIASDAEMKEMLEETGMTGGDKNGV